jgi:ketosteroid isomerase-like protein
MSAANPGLEIPQVSESVLNAMRRTNEFFRSEVIGKRNFDALDRVYTSRARILPPNAEMVEGLAGIKAFWTQAVAALGASDVKLTTVNAEQAGDGVVEIGRAEISIAAGQTVTAKYVVHWKQEGGEWKWNVDIWNTNQ